MTFYLVLNICLLSNPGTCHNEYLNSTAPSVSQCLMDQMSMAKFMAEKPSYFIHDWHCPKVGTEANL